MEDGEEGTRGEGEGWGTQINSGIMDYGSAIHLLAGLVPTTHLQYIPTLLKASIFCFCGISLFAMLPDTVEH